MDYTVLLWLFAHFAFLAIAMNRAYSDNIR